MGYPSEQPALAFENPMEARALPKWGWWTLNRKMAGGRLTQKAYSLENLEFVLRHVRRDVDTFMSQAFFAAPCRRAIHLSAATHAYVDLDIYKADNLRGLSPEQVSELVLLACRDDGLPYPSAIICSGRGLYLKYFWSSPIPRAAAGRAVAVNRALVRLFGEFGSDPAAVDMSRILRVVGTVNSKSGEIARVLWLNERGGQIVTHDFDTFADDVLPYSLEQIREFRSAAEARRAEIRILSQERARRQQQRAVEQRRRGNQRAFCPEDWHWGVLEDIRKLAEMRYPGGRVPAGERDTFGFLGACQLARVIPAGQLWYEVQSWSRLLLPADFVDRDLHRQCSTLLRRALADAMRAAGGDAKVSVYTYTKQRLIEMLRITPDEMRHMTRLIDDAEKRRRHTEAASTQRRAAGAQLRSDYMASAHADDQQIQLLAALGHSVREIAVLTGVSKSKVARILAS